MEIKVTIDEALVDGDPRAFMARALRRLAVTLEASKSPCPPWIASGNAVVDENNRSVGHFEFTGSRRSRS